MTQGGPSAGSRSHRRGIGPFSFRQIAAVGLVVVMVALGLLALTTPLGRPQQATPLSPNATFYLIGDAKEGLAVGDRAPEFAVPGPNGQTGPLLDLHGNAVRLADHRGHPVWVNFFATWCPPCQAETPTIRDVAAEYEARGLDVIGITVQESSPGDVRAYAERYGLDYTIGFDGTGAVYNAWRNLGIPTQYLIDGDGIIRMIVKGPLVERQTAEAALASIIPPDESPAPSAP
jgi:peroxiredoxin